MRETYQVHFGLIVDNVYSELYGRLRAYSFEDRETSARFYITISYSSLCELADTYFDAFNHLSSPQVVSRSFILFLNEGDSSYVDFHAPSQVFLKPEPTSLNQGLICYKEKFKNWVCRFCFYSIEVGFTIMNGVEEDVKRITKEMCDLGVESFVRSLIADSYIRSFLGRSVVMYDGDMVSLPNELHGINGLNDYVTPYFIIY